MSEALSDPLIDYNDNKLSADCPICLSQLVDKCQLSNCRHEFCLRCLLRWTGSHENCPVCRQSITSIRHNIGDDADNDYDLISVRLLDIIKRLNIHLMNDENRIERLQRELNSAQEVRQQRQQLLDQLMSIDGNDEEEINISINAVVYDIENLQTSVSMPYNIQHMDDSITRYYGSDVWSASMRSIISNRDNDTDSDIISVNSSDPSMESSNRSAYITDSIFSEDSYYASELLCPSIDDSMDLTNGLSDESNDEVVIQSMNSKDSQQSRHEIDTTVGESSKQVSKSTK
ncbi:uncharacterized protein LOC128964486 [Oppia nitens]|uniref:uncharacterized protein LOC128964486 n=1 Tax=Oppia nitens TaxID=1686743 RepID=UPI0023DAB787|nr:uncharacterized protein LOC128964486 [Oppia nitens]